MRKIYLAMFVFLWFQVSVQSQAIEQILQDIARNNKALQAQQKNDEAAKMSIEAANDLRDPSVEYSSFFTRGVSGQSGSEMVVSQGFDFPTLYGARNKSGRVQKEVIDYRREALRRDVLLNAKNLCLDLIQLNQMRELLAQRQANADELLTLYNDRLQAGDATVIEVNRIKMERMSIQTEVLQNNTAHRTALQSLLALNGNKPLEFDEKAYPAPPELLDYHALHDEVMGADAGIKAADAEMRAAHRGLIVNKQNWLPKIELGYRRNTGDGTKEHGFLVGGSIPLFSNRRQVKVAQAQSVGAQLSFEEEKLQIESGLQSRFNELQQLRRAMDVYDVPLMHSTLDLLKESVRGGEMSVIDYLVEADQIYRNLQAYMSLENQYQKVIAALYKVRL